MSLPAPLEPPPATTSPEPGLMDLIRALARRQARLDAPRPPADDPAAGFVDT